MKQTDKYLTERDQNRNQREAHKYSGPKQLRFEKIKKQSITVPINVGQSYEPGNTKKFIYDQQTMNQMIQMLKQENNELKTLAKVQQTQLNYYGEQQKNMLSMNNNTLTSSNNPQRKLQIQNYRLKKQVQMLQQQITKIKKTVKCTNIKELEAVNKVYQEQIKSLTAKLAAYEKSTKNIQQLNKIIQKQYFSTLKNKQLQAIIEDKKAQLEQSNKIIRKLKNILSQKNNQIQKLKQEKQKNQGNANKNKNMEQYVHKSELITKKKQLLAMTETIQKLELKLLQCESKAQNLQQQNVENMNRQTSKRKQIILQFQKLKKSHETLQEALALSLKKNTDMIPPMRLNNVPSLDTQFRKPKVPTIITVTHIKQAVQTIVYNLQQQSIDHTMAVNLIMNGEEWSKLEQSEKTNEKPQQKQNEEQEQQVQKPDSKISIREIIYCLQKSPLNIQNYEWGERVARYLVEDESDSSQFINFDSVVNISYARSIFKKIIQEYPIFTHDQITQHCLFIEDFLKRNESCLKNALSKLATENPKTTRQNLSKCNENQKQLKSKPVYKGSDYLEAIIKQNQLNQITHQFIKYWIFANKDQYLTYKQFEQQFKIEGVCTFITEQPQQQSLQQ